MSIEIQVGTTTYCVTRCDTCKQGTITSFFYNYGNPVRLCLSCLQRSHIWAD